MDVRVAYCSACDRTVRIRLPADADGSAMPETARAGEAVCLEHGESCTGSMCPLFDVPPATMKENLDAYRAAEGDAS